MSQLGLLFLSTYNIKLLHSPIVAYKLDFFVGLQYDVGFFSKQDTIQIQQFRIENAQLDCLALEIYKRKKESKEHYKQIEDFY